MTPSRPQDRRAITLARVLGPVEAFCVVVGCVIGSGIFLVPASVAHDVPYLGGIILVWIVGGLFSAAGALTLAELGAMMPHAGGPYVYLRAAYGVVPSFLFGWAEFTVVRTGSMATLAAAFARYFQQIFPPVLGIPPAIWQAGAAVTAIALVTFVNILGTRRGGMLQVIGTVLKVGGILAMIGLPFLVGRGTTANLSPWGPSPAAGSLWVGIMAAMVSVLWAYDGWLNVAPLAEEVRDPGRNIPRSLILGMAALIALYLGMTLAYHYVLPMSQVAEANREEGATEKAIAAVYCRELLGSYGVLAISALVMCSTFISLNGNALTGPRAYFAMARDGLLPRGLCRVHPRFHTPSNAVLAQGLWSIVLTMLGTALIMVPPPDPGATGASSWSGPLLTAWTTLNRTPLYDLLLTYVIFGATIFYMLTIASVFILRARQPDLERPYRTWGYPWTPLLYVVSAILLLGNMLIDPKSRVQSVAGLGLILLGLPAWAYFRDGERIGEPAHAT
ncbi:MAG: amino acid permease [Isosphaeraceae bacterium]